MSTKVILLILYVIFLLSEKQGASSEENTKQYDFNAFFEKFSDEIKKKKTANTLESTLETVHIIRNEPKKNGTDILVEKKMPATDEEWQFILCITLMTTVIVGSKPPNSDIIDQIKKLCPKLDKALNDPLLDSADNKSDSSLTKLMRKFKEKIKIPNGDAHQSSNPKPTASDNPKKISDQQVKA